MKGELCCLRLERGRGCRTGGGVGGWSASPPCLTRTQRGRRGARETNIPLRGDHYPFAIITQAAPLQFFATDLVHLIYTEIKNMTINQPNFV